MPRIAAPGRKRNGNLKPLKVDGKWACLECRNAIEQHIWLGKKCRPRLRCSPCSNRRYVEQRAIRGAATLAVAKAIKAGALQRPSAFACVDCGRPAAQYDHRDYTKPLSVEPVCRSCNVMRGPADVWAHATAQA